jgi:hypothetical protein
VHTTAAHHADVYCLTGRPERGHPPLSTGDTGQRHGGARIRCPRCRWEPRADDQWMCSCQHLWNTFDTRGVCPACDRKWAETQCKGCRQWSPHDAWYEQRAE